MEERRQRINNATSIQRVVEGKIRTVGGLKPTTDIMEDITALKVSPARRQSGRVERGAISLTLSHSPGGRAD